MTYRELIASFTLDYKGSNPTDVKVRIAEVMMVRSKDTVDALRLIGGVCGKNITNDQLRKHGRPAITMA